MSRPHESLLLVDPNGFDLQNEENYSQNADRTQTDSRPFFQPSFDGFSFVLAEESFGGTGDRIDTVGVAGLHQNEDDGQYGEQQDRNDDDRAERNVEPLQGESRFV